MRGSVKHIVRKVLVLRRIQIRQGKIVIFAVLIGIIEPGGIGIGMGLTVYGHGVGRAVGEKHHARYAEFGRLSHAPDGVCIERIIHGAVGGNKALRFAPRVGIVGAVLCLGTCAEVIAVNVEIDPRVAVQQSQDFVAHRFAALADLSPAADVLRPPRGARAEALHSLIGLTRIHRDHVLPVLVTCRQHTNQPSEHTQPHKNFSKSHVSPPCKKRAGRRFAPLPARYYFVPKIRSPASPRPGTM